MYIRKSEGEKTLPWGTPEDIILYEDSNIHILVHCILLCRKFEKSLCEKLLCHSDRVFQVKFYGHSSQTFFIDLEIRGMLLVYCQNFGVVHHK